MGDAGAGSVLIIGLGNGLRGDDGAGLEVARRLRAAAAHAAGIEVRELRGEPIELLDLWQNAAAVVLVDTMRSGAPAGTIKRFDASREALPLHTRAASSTHALGLGEALELARSLDRLPERVIVYAVEGRAFEPGAALSPEIETALTAVAGEALQDARASRSTARE